MTVSERTEIRARTQPSSPTVIDAETALGTTVTLARARSTFTLSYAPRLSLYDAFGSRAYGIFHSGRLGGLWTFRRMTFGLGVDGSIGTQSSAGLSISLIPDTGVAPSPTPTDPTTPRQQDVRATFLLPSAVLFTGSASVASSLSYALSQRWAASVSVSAGMAGGIEWISQQILPPSRNVSAGASLGYRLSQRDTVGFGVAGSVVRVLQVPAVFVTRAGGSTFVSSFATATWAHVFSERTQGSVGAGVAVLEQLAPTSGGASFSGTGSVGFSHTAPLSHRVTLGLNAAGSVNNVYNPFVGAVQQSAFGGVGASVGGSRLSFGLNGSAAVTLPLDDPAASRSISGAATLGYAAEKWIQVQTGARVALQLFPSSLGTDLPPQWVYFAALTLTSSPITL